MSVVQLVPSIEASRRVAADLPRAEPDQPSCRRVILGAMRALVGGLLVALVWWTPLAAQERTGVVDRLRLGLEQPLPGVRGVGPIDGAAPKSLGIFTLIPPSGPGEMVRVSVPVGELVSRAFKGVAAANHRRQEAAARRTVEAALKRFAEQQPSRGHTTRP
jgi:hypothetical protein